MLLHSIFVTLLYLDWLLKICPDLFSMQGLDLGAGAYPLFLR